MYSYTKELNVLIVDESKKTNESVIKKFNAIKGFDMALRVCDLLGALNELRKAKTDVFIVNSEISELEEYIILHVLKRSPVFNPRFVYINAPKNNCTLSIYPKSEKNERPADILNLEDYEQIISLAKRFCKNLPKAVRAENNDAVWNPFKIADFTMKNPYQDLLQTAQSDEKKWQAVVTQLLLKLNVRPKLKGFSYIRDGVTYIISEGDEFSSVTKEIYPRVAQNHNTDADRVERSIRTAIEVAFKSEEITRLYVKTFGPMRERKSLKKNPSNRDFIFTLAEYLKSNNGIDSIINNF